MLYQLLHANSTEKISSTSLILDLSLMEVILDKDFILSTMFLIFLLNVGADSQIIQEF